MLKRHLASKYQMTLAQYRTRWDLPSDYPMVAPEYSARRSQMVTLHRQDRPAALAWRFRYAAVAALVIAGFVYGALAPPDTEDWFTAAFAVPKPFDVN